MFKKNKIYNVFIKPDSKIPMESVIFIEDGFSFMAFIFNAFWSIYQRLWKLTGLILGFFIILMLLSELDIVSQMTSDILNMGFMAWIGFEAFEWKCDSIRKKGYILYDIICASNETEANIRFFDRHLPKLMQESAD